MVRDSEFRNRNEVLNRVHELPVANKTGSNTLGRVSSPHARLAFELIGPARSTHAVVAVLVLITTVQAVTILSKESKPWLKTEQLYLFHLETKVPTSIANELLVDATTRVAFEHLRWTGVVSIATLADRFVLASRTVLVTIAEPRVRYALVVTAPELTRCTRNRVTEQTVLVRIVTAIVVAITQPSSHDTDVRVRAFDV